MGFALSDIELTSSAFAPGGAIGTEFTGEGADISPQLAWQGIPDGTRSFAIVCHDPDAPLVGPRGTYGYVHWVLYNIPASVQELNEGCGDYTRGLNDFGNPGYGGPMPPPGHGEHKYYFWILALSEMTEIPEGLTMWELLETLESSIIGMNRLIGTYQRD